jgi:hypothetical protein
MKSFCNGFSVLGPHKVLDGVRVSVALVRDSHTFVSQGTNQKPSTEGALSVRGCNFRRRLQFTSRSDEYHSRVASDLESACVRARARVYVCM